MPKNDGPLQRAERYRDASRRITSALSSALSVKEAAPQVLEVLCDTLGWELGIFWQVDDRDHVLRAVTVWTAPTIMAEQFTRETMEVRFERGAGVIGKVWDSGEPTWIPDTASHPGFTRAETAAREDLHAAALVPVPSRGNADDVLAVLEFFKSSRESPDIDLLDMLDTIGSQVSQFLKRIRAEEKVREMTAFEIYEDIVQNLVIAQASTRAGKHEQAEQCLATALTTAKRIVTHLMESGQVDPQQAAAPSPR